MDGELVAIEEADTAQFFYMAPEEMLLGRAGVQPTISGSAVGERNVSGSAVEINVSGSTSQPRIDGRR